jgi:DsbC/DsbD-like thiol-disulfide interchange protein
VKPLALLFPLALSLGAQAQLPGTTQWNASLLEQGTHKPGAPLLVAIDAKVQDGWHVYAASQAPGGPTPLSVKIEPDAPYQLAGPLLGTTPTKHHDASFDLDTQFYTGSFHLQLPVSATAASGSVPIAVRYQMCSDTTCMPPKTVHLVAEADRKN